MIIAKQEIREIYIPKIAWKAEGRWHIAEKVKMLKSILDAANPVDPPLKLSIQKEIAVALGLGALDWSVNDRLVEVRMENLLLEAKVDQEKLKRGETIEKKSPEQKLIEQLEKRKEGGVSRTPRDLETEKGISKELGGTRYPFGESKDLPKELYDAMLKGEQLRNEKAEIDLQNSKLENEAITKKVEALREFKKKIKKEKES